jgi:hypothetical protein
VIAYWYPSHSSGISVPSAPDISPRATAKDVAQDLQDEASWGSETPNHSLMGRYFHFHRIEISMGCRDIYIINNGFAVHYLDNYGELWSIVLHPRSSLGEDDKMTDTILSGMAGFYFFWYTH